MFAELPVPNQTFLLFLIALNQRFSLSLVSVMDRCQIMVIIMIYLKGTDVIFLTGNKKN